MIIYRIVNRLDGRSYIGQTSMSLAQRVTGHINKRSAIGRDIVQYGKANFDISVLDVVETKAAADKSERYWIAFYNTVERGYNILSGGTPSRKEMRKLSLMPKKKYRKHKRGFKETKRCNTAEAREWRKQQQEQARRAKYTKLPLSAEQIQIACLINTVNGTNPTF